MRKVESMIFKTDFKAYNAMSEKLVLLQAQHEKDMNEACIQNQNQSFIEQMVGLYM